MPETARVTPIEPKKPRITMFRTLATIESGPFSGQSIIASKHKTEIVEGERGLLVKIEGRQLCIPYNNIAYWAIE